MLDFSNLNLCDLDNSSAIQTVNKKKIEADITTENQQTDSTPVNLQIQKENDIETPLILVATYSEQLSDPYSNSTNASTIVNSMLKPSSYECTLSQLLDENSAIKMDLTLQAVFIDSDEEQEIDQTIEHEKEKFPDQRTDIYQKKYKTLKS